MDIVSGETDINVISFDIPLRLAAFFNFFSAPAEAELISSQLSPLRIRMCALGKNEMADIQWFHFSRYQFI